MTRWPGSSLRKQAMAAGLAGDPDQRIAAFLLGGAALLLCELRFEHREALGEAWQSWIPLLYCGLLLLAGGAALLRWRSWGRRALAVVFALGVAVGLAGCWFHTGGHLLNAVQQLFSAWLIPLGRDGGVKQGARPPALAPLAFCGLGSLGLLVCAGPGRR
jgi:hypothetical protein